MDHIDNGGEKIGSLAVSLAADKMIIINRFRNITTVSVRDRNPGQVSTETFFGDRIRQVGSAGEAPLHTFQRVNEAKEKRSDSNPLGSPHLLCRFSYCNEATFVSSVNSGQKIPAAQKGQKSEHRETLPTIGQH